MLAFAGLFAAFALQAQNHKVTLQLQDDTTGDPVGFATVSLTPEKGQPKYTLSDAEGHAALEKVRTAKYTLKAEIMGYKTYEQSLEVKENLNLGIIKMAQDRGWIPFAGADGVMDWDDVLEYDGDGSDSDPSEPGRSSTEDLILYLQTLFEPEDYVGYVTNDVWQTDGGKWVPGKGTYFRTA